MENPWKEVALGDYESHMALEGVYQLQTLDRIMHSQFESYPVLSVAILGIAGGNGLGNLESIPSIKNIYGIDINPDYLKASQDRAILLGNRYHTINVDVNDDISSLPSAELVIANLFIEYVGYTNFAKAINNMAPKYVSCVIQIDPEDSYVSDSPYSDKLSVLDSVHRAINEETLTSELSEIGYMKTLQHPSHLPNKKVLLRLDYQKGYLE